MLIKNSYEEEGINIDIHDGSVPSDNYEEAFTLRLGNTDVKMGLSELQRVSELADFAIQEYMRRQ